MEALSPVTLGTIIFLGFIPSLILRVVLVKHYLEKAAPLVQPYRAFLLEFSLCLLTAATVGLYNYFALGFPATSLSSFVFGCVIAGFFIGLDSSLISERAVILEVIQSDQSAPVATKFFSLTQKYMIVSIATLGLVSLVLILVFVHDVGWLVKTSQDAESMAEARISVLTEILFIMGVLLLLMVNLIISYSKNLKLLFRNQTRILEQVRKGDLSSKVPVATSDEFGVIAGHTNHMIEGLRHRFELINDLRFAEKVQQNLLPSKSPYLADIDVSGYSLYCDQTGGDYYDYFLLPNERTGIVVADACGHGVGAAMLMTSVRAFLIAEMRDYQSPSTLIRKLNELLVEDCSVDSTFTTMFFLEIDPIQRTLKWIRAGHEPAFYFHAKSREFTELSGPGLALGIENSFQFQEQHYERLESGDVILIGTDGIHEAFDVNQLLFGKERVKKIIEEHCNASARDIRDALVEQIHQHQGNLPQEDDITMVVVKVK